MKLLHQDKWTKQTSLEVNKNSISDFKEGEDLLVKSHHMQFINEIKKEKQERESIGWRIENVGFFSAGGILLIRNPFDAIRLVSHSRKRDKILFF